MWFDNWSDIIRTLLVGTAAYVGLIVVLRVTGKRTLSQLNTFDFIVTVAIGSTLATILLSVDVSWAEGMVALALLAGLQLVVALLSALWPPMRSFFTASPVLLVCDGEYRDEAIRRNRLTRSEVRQAIRGTGTGDVSRVAAVVLETNGKLSVITSDSMGDGSALEGVKPSR
ncbi:DUF421 domain-containing protein [Salinibacterium sp. dk2585]|uniref:DUF421 domain-containing protein n=1 Tax=unclassified Salinibacterium TaxID=2632331 RepID=UPI0011C24D6B|nr:MULTISPECIES: YetF domain-containing protein [unclassified Salinibacterium]QEE60331.1 DUF421 domain-containing protein [Salinibacterium sp. dk2585]TXK55403.1 DUF421 domain-containing protein [Salinibacterium sp. dk5596]